MELQNFCSEIEQVQEYELIESEMIQEDFTIPENGLYFISESRLFIFLDRIGPFYYSIRTQAQTNDAAWSFLLLLAGENHTYWNIKRQNFTPDFLKSDLALTRLICKKFSKASVAWDYRRFLISQSIDYNLQDEVDLWVEIAQQKRQHYYIWLHRQLLNIPNDLESMYRYCEREISDSSAWSYLQECVCRQKDYSNALQWVIEVIRRYYGPEGLYVGQVAYGYESVHWFRIQMAAQLEQDNLANEIAYAEEERAIGRNLYYDMLQKFVIKENR